MNPDAQVKECHERLGALLEETGCTIEAGVIKWDRGEFSGVWRIVAVAEPKPSDKGEEGDGGAP